jgi:hypothetical protein
LHSAFRHSRQRATRSHAKPTGSTGSAHADRQQRGSFANKRASLAGERALRNWRTFQLHFADAIRLNHAEHFANIGGNVSRTKSKPVAESLHPRNRTEPGLGVIVHRMGLRLFAWSL